MPERDVSSTVAPLLVVGRYAIFDRIASGGMATVHLGRLVGAGGFLRTVAIKRLHPQFAHDREFTEMLLEEARLVTRIHHPNVIPTLDVVAEGDELLLVMEYVRGVSLDRLIRTSHQLKKVLPPNVVVAALTNVLHGLHAAHEALDERRAPLGLVHRDVSPHNVLVGIDGVSRVLDFGIAKVQGRVSTTREGHLKGKIRYMAPEQITGTVSRSIDVYAAGIVLFEALTSERMFGEAAEVEAAYRILEHKLRMPSEVDPALAPFDVIVAKATAAAPEDRYATAKEMADHLERVLAPAPLHDVGTWVTEFGRELLEEQAEMVAQIERSTTISKIPAALASATGRSRLDGVNAIEAGATITSASAVVDREIVLPVDRLRSKLIVGAVAVALLAALFFVTQRRASTPSALASSASVGPAPTAIASASAASWNGIAVSPPTVVRDEERPVATVADGSAPVAVAASARPKGDAVRNVAPPQPSARVADKPGKPGKPACDPPYTFDADGHRHYILECMK